MNPHVLVVQNRISARRPAVLPYITNQLLHSLVAIKREVDSEPVQFDWTGWSQRQHSARRSGKRLPAGRQSRVITRPPARWLGTTTPVPLRRSQAGVR